MGLFDSVSSFFNQGAGYKSAANSVGQGWERAQNFLEPYQNAGLSEIAVLNKLKDQLLNPEQLQNQWASGYEQSPYAQQLLRESSAAGLDSASQQGLVGSSAALNNVTTSAGNIVSQDRQRYLDDLMQKYMQGIGISSGFYNTGVNTGNALASGALQTGQNLGSANLGAQNAGGEMLGKLLGLGIGGFFGK